MAEDTNEGEDEDVVDDAGEAVPEADASEAGDDAPEMGDDAPEVTAAGEGDGGGESEDGGADRPGTADGGGDDGGGDDGGGDDGGDGPGFDFETEVEETDVAGASDEFEETGGVEAPGEGAETDDVAEAEPVDDDALEATLEGEETVDGAPGETGVRDDAAADAGSESDRDKSLAELDRELEEMDVGPGTGDAGTAASGPAGAGEPEPDAEGEVVLEREADADGVREPASASTGEVADERYCSNCGSALAAEAEICPECGVRVGAADDGDEKDPGIAALLSFLIPGLGNIYDEDMERGLAILVAWVLWLGVVWFFGGLIVIPIIGGLTLGIGFVLWLVLPLLELVFHAVAAYDAYNRAS